MGNNSNPPPVSIQLTRLGDTDYGITDASIEVKIDNEAGTATYVLVTHGGRVRNVVPNFKPLAVVTKVIGVVPIHKLLESFQAVDAETEPKLKLVLSDA